MKRTILGIASCLVLTACGAGKPAQAPDGTNEEIAAVKDPSAKSKGDGESKSGGAPGSADMGDTSSSDAKGDAPKKDECTGFDIGDLEAVLNKVACETENPKPDDKFLDPKDKLEVKLSASTMKVAPGQHADLVVTLTNKSKEPLPLLFTIDPVPRFEVETYDAKNRRVDMPSSQPPPLPKGIAPRVAGDPKTAKVTLAPNGNARLRLGWDAVKTRWAPEKLRGSPPEKGYPRAPAGPLPRGKYTVRVVMPLTGVLEGVDKEVSAPKTAMEVGK